MSLWFGWYKKPRQLPQPVLRNLPIAFIQLYFDLLPRVCASRCTTNQVTPSYTVIRSFPQGGLFRVFFELDIHKVIFNFQSPMPGVHDCLWLPSILSTRYPTRIIRHLFSNKSLSTRLNITQLPSARWHCARHLALWLMCASPSIDTVIPNQHQPNILSRSRVFVKLHNIHRPKTTNTIVRSEK